MKPDNEGWARPDDVKRRRMSPSVVDQSGATVADFGELETFTLPVSAVIVYATDARPPEDSLPEVLAHGFARQLRRLADELDHRTSPLVIGEATA